MKAYRTFKERNDKIKWDLIKSFSKRNILPLIGIFLLGSLRIIFTLMIPVLIGRFFELSFNNYSSSRLILLENFFPFASYLKDLDTMLAFFIILIIFRFFAEYISRFLIGLLGEKFVKELREKLFEHQLHVKQEVYDSSGIGKYLLRYSADLKTAKNYYTKGILRFALDLFFMSLFLLLLLYLNSAYALLFVILLVISLIPYYYFSFALHNISTKKRDFRASLLSYVNSRLRAIESVKVFNKYEIEKNRFYNRSENLYKSEIAYQSILRLLQAMIPVITYFLLAILMYIGHHKGLEGNTHNEASTYLVLFMAIFTLLPILRNLLRVVITWRLGNISFYKLGRILLLERDDTLPYVKESFKNEPISILPKQGTALQQIDIKSNRITFIDSYKHPDYISHLIKLRQNSDIDIFIGDRNYSKISEKSIRRNISVVNQNFPIYGKNVLESVVYNKNPTLIKRAERLLEQLQIHETEKIDLNQKLVDLASNLNNSQKLILHYCRALTTAKPILLLTHPFDGLKAETKELIIKKLNKLSDNKTIVVFDNDYPKSLKVDTMY